MRRIVVVGSINADLVTRSGRLPGPGETVAGQSFAIFAGGKGANQAVGIARLAVPVSLVGMVGSDSFGHELRDGLAGWGVDTAAVEQVKGASGVAVIQVEPAGENRITVVAGANAALTADAVRRHGEVVRGAAMVLCQLEIPLETVEAVAGMCAEANVPLMLDPAPARELPRALLEQVSWLTPNLHEARVLLERQDAGAEEMARALVTAGVRGVVVKLGAEGVVALARGGELVRVPAFPVEVVDTTAAGDAFNAGFAVGLVRGMELGKALRFGVAVAAVSVTRAGAQPSMPDRAEVDRMLQERW